MEANVPSRELGPLLSLNYQRLQTAQSSSDPEVLKLFDAVRGLGFFYLDLRDNIRETAFSDLGESSILEKATSLFGLMNKFFDLSVPEKQKYSVTSNGGYFG